MVRRVDDLAAGSLLKNVAIIEIRAMARRAKPLEFWPNDDYVACIAWLADLCHSMPDASLRRGGLYGFIRRRSDRRRPFLHAWRVADSIGREWMVDRLEREGVYWTPPV